MRLELNPDLAKCTSPSIDPDIFFMDDKNDEDYSAIQTEIARSICFTCELREQCLKYAIEEDEEGVWGGTTTYERRVAKTRKRRNYVPLGRASISEKALKTGKIANKNRAIEASKRDRELLSRALVAFSDIEQLTVEMAKLRIAEPDLTLAELSAMMNVSKDVFAGRLKRLIRRLESNGQDERQVD